MLFGENRTRNSLCLNADDLTFSGKVWYIYFKEFHISMRLDCACMNAGEGNPLACAWGIRGPSPYGEKGIFSTRFSGARMMARDRPSPYGERRLFSTRSAGACPPRSLDCACMHDGEGNPLACACGMRGPKPYGERGIFSARSAGACPPRSLECADDIKTGMSLLRGRH